jgi:hemoglobin
LAVTPRTFTASTAIMVKKDIAIRQDIELLINSFYAKVRQDDELGIIFNEVVKMDWPHHTAIIVDFWETILFDADLYRKNAMEPHFTVNKMYPLQHRHFQKWLQLFFATLDAYFEGPITTLAKTRAKGIAGIMEIKMDKINQTTNELDTKKL